MPTMYPSPGGLVSRRDALGGLGAVSVMATAQATHSTRAFGAPPPVRDINNRGGGPHLVVTAKNANKIQFYDAGTIQLTKAIDLPASTHELVLSPDGRKVFASVYGGGIFGRTKDPDQRIAVIDLETRAIERFIDVGPQSAPHGIMFDSFGALWATAELGNALLAIDPDTGLTQRIELGSSPHWLAISHTARKLFASNKASGHVTVVDQHSRKAVERIAIPNLCEGLAVTPDGETLLVCAHQAPELHVIDARTLALRKTLKIEGSDDTRKQLRRVRISPDQRYVCVSSHVEGTVAIWELPNFKPTGFFPVNKAPMGFAFAADGHHAFVCNHDDANVSQFELSTGRIINSFATEKGCEFILSYSL